MIKKLIGLSLSLVLLASVTGCAGNVPAGETSSAPSTSASQQTEQETVSTEPVIETESSAAPEENSETPTISLEPNQEETMESKVLVAYFSATGTTEQVARQAAEILGAELYEIVPEEPYTAEDLAYYTGGRADQEQDDPSARPGIANHVEDMDQYDTVLLGYPIWHGQAPRIISTFLERYDFSGKTIVPFCTSHSSGVGSSAENLHGLCPDTVTWAEGTRFASGASREEIESWLQAVLPGQFTGHNQ